MRLLQTLAATTAASIAAALGFALPAAVERGILPQSFAILIGIGLLCVLAYGLSLLSNPED